MKFALHVRDETGPKVWVEHMELDYVNSQEEAEEVGCLTIAHFNATLGLGESPRTLVKVEVEEKTKGEVKDHEWEKTNLVTLRNDAYVLPYDTAKCSRCGITGKRFGLGARVCRDRKFLATVYDRCDMSMKKRKIEHVVLDVKLPED